MAFNILAFFFNRFFFLLHSYIELHTHLRKSRIYDISFSLHSVITSPSLGDTMGPCLSSCVKP